ncbi:MAG TPA: class I SAM-dependent methyltransferase [Myxococcota bacterium]|nr:class I SAM-dependent methyltransferase [Myxococcota bacterium]
MQADAGDTTGFATRPTGRSEAGGCDLCGAGRGRVVAEASPLNARIVECAGCGLLYASPRMSDAEMDAFYEQGFAIDPGSRLRAGAGLPNQRKVDKEKRQSTDWALAVIDRHVDVRGKRVLGLRCRTGGISEALAARGATVHCIEPFEANASYARQVRGLSHVHVLPFSQLHAFGETAPGPFDVVDVLAQHVLAHVASPSRLLSEIHAALVPGGLLFLDEKDVLHPALHKTPSIFESGTAHQYHLTERTTAGYLRAAGFEILRCEIDPHRMSDFRHIVSVARKPERASEAREPDIGPPADGALDRRLRWLARTWRWRLAQAKLRRRAQRWQRKRARASTHRSPSP